MYYSDELDGMLADGIPVVDYYLADCPECDGEQWFAVQTECCIECGEHVARYDG